MKPKAIFLMGPTATGKTDLAVEIVARYPCEIISVDSVMVYRQMDIGSAKPEADVLAVAPHHLINVCDVREAYSAARFADDARAIMADICERGKVPLLVGGTMLYFKALEHGLSPLPSADPVVRAELSAVAQSEGWPALHRRLREIDPVAAEKIEPTDAQRIQRALEVHRLTGRPLSELQRESSAVWAYDTLKLALCADDRTRLHRRIEARFQQMIRDGLIDEVRSLFALPGVHTELPSMRAVGYRQIGQFLDGASDESTAIEKGVVATRQLAKRQMTWIRAQQHCERIDWEANDVAVSVMERVDRTIQAAYGCRE